MIGGGFPLRLPAKMLDGQSNQGFTIFGNPVNAPRMDFSDQSWEGRRLGGSDRYGWPVWGTIPFLAKLNGTDEAGFLASSKLTVAPANIFGRGGHLVRAPRSLLWSVVQRVSDGDDFPAAVRAAIQGIGSQLSDANVLVAEGALSSVDLSDGGGFVLVRPPYQDSSKIVEISNEGAGTIESQAIVPNASPDVWIASEVLYMTFSEYLWAEGPWLFSTGVDFFPEARAAEVAFWQESHPNHKRVRYQNFTAFQQGPFPDFEANRVSAGDLFANAVADYDFHWNHYSGTLLQETATILADAIAVIESFFGIG